MSKYAKIVSPRATPQSEPIPGSNQVPNSAGGFSFQVDDWKQLERFLIIGSEGGTYHIGERKLTLDNAKAVQRCLDADPKRAIEIIATVSEQGRAPKNDPAVFALALAAAHKNPNVRALALEALQRVCRIGTHIYQFVPAVRRLKPHKGLGRGLRRALANWYLSKSASNFAYQALKYQNREGWSHRDIFRLARPKFEGTHNDIAHWVVKGWEGVGEGVHPNKDLQLLWAFERLKKEPEKKLAVRLIRDHGLTREMVPTELLNEKDVWEALLEKMPLTALIRNLNKMTAIGLLAPLSQAVKTVNDKLSDQEYLKKSRIHPLKVLVALKAYGRGRGGEGNNLTWTPVQQVMDVLDGAFYLTFGNVPVTNKRWMLALDVSGSMTLSEIAGMTGVTPRVASAAMALITAAVEPEHYMVGFSSASGEYRYLGQRHTPGLAPVAITPKMRLDNAIEAIERVPMGGTDCALPYLHAIKEKLPVDVFVSYTDAESWAGAVHASQALVQYREKTGIPAKAIMVAMTANNFTVLDPDDAGSLTVCGFSPDTPAVMSDFVLDGQVVATDNDPD